MRFSRFVLIVTTALAVPSTATAQVEAEPGPAVRLQVSVGPLLADAASSEPVWASQVPPTPPAPRWMRNAAGGLVRGALIGAGILGAVGFLTESGSNCDWDCGGPFDADRALLFAVGGALYGAPIGLIVGLVGGE